MKLVLKDNQEITISNMNRAHYFKSITDGVGQVVDRNGSVTLFILNPTESYDDIVDKINGNTTDFKVVCGEDEKSFVGWEIDTISEEYNDERHIVNITLIKKAA